MPTEGLSRCHEGCQKNKATYDVNNLYRYEKLFREEPDAALAHFAYVPSSMAASSSASTGPRRRRTRNTTSNQTGDLYLQDIR